jgi:hypothetical protein
MLLLLLPLVLGDPTPVTSRIQEVTLYGSNALVTRTAELAGGGNFVLQGLPETIDPDNVRVRCEGGDVVDVEVRRRVVDQVPSARLQELRNRLTGLQREMKVLEDERSVLKTMLTHLQSLMNVSTTAHNQDVQGGKPSVETWDASWKFVSERLAANVASTRISGRSAKGGDRKQADRTVPGSGDGELTCWSRPWRRARGAVEYLVNKTGWQPAYDLRASKDLKGVELSYRAKVWQQTGEDWKDVDLVLSTAAPQRGAQGPEPQPVWLTLYEPPIAAARVSYEEADRGMAPREAEEGRKMRALGYTGKDAPATAPAPRPFAAVESQGLSVHFRLPQKESIESRELPTTVLVGSAKLEMRPSACACPPSTRRCGCARRRRTRVRGCCCRGRPGCSSATTTWGPAQIDTVQTGQELTLALGADRGSRASARRRESLSKGPGFLSSRSSKIEAWRMHFENHGTSGDGGGRERRGDRARRAGEVERRQERGRHLEGGAEAVGRRAVEAGSGGEGDRDVDRARADGDEGRGRRVRDGSDVPEGREAGEAVSGGPSDSHRVTSRVR